MNESILTAHAGRAHGADGSGGAGPVFHRPPVGHDCRRREPWRNRNAPRPGMIRPAPRYSTPPALRPETAIRPYVWPNPMFAVRLKGLLTRWRRSDCREHRRPSSTWKEGGTSSHALTGPR